MAVRIEISGCILSLASVLSGSASAQDSDLEKRFEELQEQMRRLEAAQKEDQGGLAEWLKRVRISGSANAGSYSGEEDSYFPKSQFSLWDTRLFLDVDLGSDVEIGGTRVMRNVGFFFEHDWVRLGSLANRVGEAYVDLQGVLDSDWLNFQVGRFQLPVSENYLRFSRGYKDNPFISNTVGGPWYWDEGVRAYGKDPGGGLGYVASISNGDNSFNGDSNADKQFTLKLFADPADWLHLSASGLRAGTTGSSTSPASGSIWFGEAWPRAFGSGTAVTNFDHGVAVADGPNKLNNTTVLGADAVLSFEDLVRSWFAYGVAEIDSEGGSLYDRRLQYWIAEAVLQGAAISEELRPLYLGFRANGLGTYNPDEGYLLDFRFASAAGYNMESLDAYSIVAGWRLTKNATLRAEYTFLDAGLVRGVTSTIREAVDRLDYFAVELGVHF